jgi:Terpene cyclase DEP1
MSATAFRVFLVLLAVGFAVAFVVVVVPPLVESRDIVGAFAAGFVNPFSSGYALDAIICWLVLAVWVIYEAKAHGIKHGWVALLLGATPGVATGFAIYLLLRMNQQSPKDHMN